MNTDHIDSHARTCRPSTEAFHQQLVERAVVAIQRRFSEDNLYLAAIADAAISSPFHLARLFRRISGVPPRHFLTAVRMQAAKRLLLDTNLSVTDVCLEVGFSSLGTFTKRFGELVGVSPRTYRRLAQTPPRSEHTLRPARAPQRQNVATVYGEIVGAGTLPVVVGLFPTALPQGRPVACSVIASPGPYRITSVPEGRYFVLAAALDFDRDLSSEPDLRGAADTFVMVSHESPSVRADIRLRRRRLTDPPIVVALPLLLAETMSKVAQPQAI
jgi:AraC-like DNA-binding protein